MSPREADDIARQLQASEARLRRVFEDSPISLQLIARDGRTLRVNRAWLELWDVPEQVLERYVYETYNIFEDAFLQANGTTDLVRRAFAGETFALPPIRYDPAETGRPGRARWVEVYIYPIRSAEGVIDEVVLMHDDITERRRAELTLRFLAEISSALLATALDYETTLKKVAELGMRQLGGWCAVHLLEAGRLKLAAVAHLEQEKADHLARLWQDPQPLEELGYGPVHVVRTGESELRREFADILESEKKQAAKEQLAGAMVKSYLSIPLRQRGEVIGALTLLSADRFYSSEDLVLAQELADRAALALQNARLYDESQRAITTHKLLAETMLQGVVHQGSSGTIVSMNPAAERILGKTREEFLGSSSVGEEHHTIREGGSPFPGTDHPSMVALRTGQPVRDVIMGVFNPRASAYRWIQVDAVPLFRPGEARPYEVYTVFADITERKRGEEALRESEERLRVLVSASSDVVYRMGPDWREMRYLSGREFIADTEAPTASWLATYIPEDERPRVMNAIEEAIRNKRTFVLEHRVVRVDGSIGWTLSRAVPLLDSHGEIIEWLGTATDITERKRGDEALRQEEARLASIYAAVTDVIFLLAVEGDGEYRFESVNQAFSETTGLTPEAVLGRRVEEVIPEPSLTLVRDRYREAITTRKPVRWQETTNYPTGQLVGDVTVTPLFAPDGHATHVVGAVHDITDRKRAEEALRDANEHLREADRRKNEFLAALSHELRNPLAPIRNSLFILSRAAPGGEQAQRAQAVIERQVGHMTRLIDDLLDVTRITRGKVQLRLEVLDLNELTLRTVEDHRGAFVADEIELQAAGAPSQVWVKGDRTRLAQVIGNLLQNAAKFTARGGKTTVSVQTDATGGRAIVRVQDTGKGIPPEMLPRLFEAFAQADTTLDRKKGGLGLGLALVKGLVEMHGGTVSGASGGPGTGATFTITLPLATTVAAETGQPDAEAAIQARRVLVIEDNVDAAQSLREALELWGHEVEVACSGPEGIEKARSFGPEVVLCDIGLPEMDGYQVARAMRADPELGRVTLVALTGYAGREDVAKSKEAGFDAHLAKPPSMEAIERALKIRSDASEQQPEV